MNEQAQQRGNDESKDQEGKAFVAIKVNALEVKIHRGSESGLEIKKAASCPSTHLLKLLPGLEVIGNTEKVTIKGGEEFVCHAPIGQAS